MKGILVGLLAVLLTLPGTALAAKGKVGLKTIQDWQEKYTVVLVGPKGREFCSGGIVGDKIMTAAHCCAVMVWAEMEGKKLSDFGYSFDGVTKRPIASYHNDIRGNDICEITPTYPEISPIKQGEFLLAGDSQSTYEKDHWVINKITYIYDDPLLKFMELQRVYRIGFDEDDTRIVVMQGDGMPGTSGSLILNSRGEYVGNLIVGLGKDTGCCIPHVFGVSQIELTEWGDTPF